MNQTQSSDPINENIHSETGVHTLKWLFSRNPFYIFSAGLLLYAIYRLSIDPRMFATELGQLLFNFGSFQVYELLLVGTAIFLARRQIGYDSALLVSLETLFVFVPFILISQALLIEGDVAAIFCFGATALAVVRFASVKKYFTGINLPPRLLLLGGVLLLVNLGLPLLVRMLHQDTNIFIWERKGGSFYGSAWLIAMPILFALANFLPRAKEQGELLVQKGYFPLTIFALWTAVTGAHLYSVGYVYGLKSTASFLVPILWVAAWTLRNRIHDFDLLDDESKADLREMLLVPTTIVPLIAAFTGDWLMFFVIALLNAAGYAFFTLRDRNSIAFHLLLISGAMIFAGLPKSVFELFQLDVSRGQTMAIGFGAYILLRAILSRSPKLGILAGIVVAIGATFLFRRSGAPFDIGIQLGLLFLLIHSLRWVDAEHLGATGARFVAALLWVIHAALWLSRNDHTALFATASFAVVAIVVYFAVKMIFGFWGPRVVPYAAMLVLICKPVLLAQTMFKDAPTGVIALVASFVLFALGTAAALTKNRWNKNERTLVPNTQINTTL
ncbi:MAG: hypothetical protein H0X66_17425 [Verrucomicrobia bacterium]|nr:hypothetical protein [Verrucomicrobiota bacterium]